jgi:hypothetical protein
VLKGSAFGPDEIQLLSSAFEAALRELNLVDRSDPATELVAKRVIELVQQGERDPLRLREGAVKSFVSPGAEQVKDGGQEGRRRSRRPEA